MSPDVVREWSQTPNVIRVTTPPQVPVVKVVTPGAQGVPGPRLLTNSFTRGGPIVVPFSSDFYWFIKDVGVVDVFSVYVNTAPTGGPITATLVTATGTVLSTAVISIGANSALGNVGGSVPANSPITVNLAGPTSVTGAVDLTASVSVRE